LLAISLLGVACTGSISGDSSGRPPDRRTGTGGSGSSGGSGGSGGTGGVDEPLPPPPGGICDTGPSPIRLLTNAEYANTIRDLFGSIAPGDITGMFEFPEDARPVGGYSNDISRPASDALVEKFGKASEKLATLAVARKADLLGGCDPARDQMGCINKFLDSFGKRAWRRPLQQAEKANLTRAFTDAAQGKTFDHGLAAVIEVMLMSPQFLYRYEQGIDVSGTKYAKLTSWEVASRLSYLLWGTMPDADLMAAAEANKLGTKEEILAQARRMVNDDRHMPIVKSFMSQLMHVDHLTSLEKDTNELPKWNPELRQPMYEEATRLIQAVMSKDGDGKLSTLLTAPYAYINGPLAAHYGVTGVTGDQFQKVTMPAGKYSGILTQAGMMATHATTDNGLTSLVFRGKFVKEELLCTIIPDPPANAELENPPFNENTTAREWAELRMAKPICGTCHQIMDPIGFLFENFDPIGKWRDADRGKPVNTNGELTGTDVDGKLKNVVELGQKLATSKDVSSCMSKQWFRYAAGRGDVEKRDDCTLQILQKAMNDSGGDLRQLLLAYTQTDAFLYRSKGDAP
jgi:hypothetical protein